MTWKRIQLLGDEEHALMMGVAGTIPTATSNDVCDFLVVVPFAMTLKRLKTTVKVKPSGDTTVQLRKSTDGGATFSNVAGWTVSVTAAGSGKVHTSDPVDTTVDEGDVLGFSITSGGGSGSNLALQAVGVAR